MSKSYRPEIDGLRAISVIAVIVYHFGLFYNNEILPGGYIGVDIFFVISGYLIGRNLLSEYYLTNSINLKQFYIKRAKRILPALFFILLVTTIFANLFLAPRLILNYNDSLFSSILFVSNFYFWFTGQAYGSPQIIEQPLLHTWSLSVEEQFYIIFPLIVIFFLNFFY